MIHPLELTEITVASTRERLGERGLEFVVLGVHQHVGTRLDLRAPRVQVERSRAATRHDVAADGVVGLQQDRHRRFDLLALGVTVVDHHEVALVAHDAANLEPGGAGGVGQPTGIVDVAAAAGESDIDVDEYGSHTASDRGGKRLVGVDRHGDVRLVGECPEPSGVECLVGEQQVVAESGSRKALDLLRGRGAEAGVPVGVEPGGHGGGLERLHVGSQSGPRQHGVHRREVPVERGHIDQ